MQSTQSLIKQDFSFREKTPPAMIRTTVNEQIQHKEERLLEWVLTRSPPNDPRKSIDAIDEFCSKHWMMNLGPEKSKIVLKALHACNPRTIVELGGYCGYSALVLASNSSADAAVYSVQISQRHADISRRIMQHAGLASKVTLLVGDVAAAANQLKALGKIDFLFIDHEKTVYLQDFKLIESYGVIKKGSVVVGDNMIYPGAPDYIQHFAGRKDFDSTMYQSYLEYTTDPDAVLVSVKLE